MHKAPKMSEKVEVHGPTPEKKEWVVYRRDCKRPVSSTVHSTEGEANGWRVEVES